MNIVILGAAGFIGTNLVLALAKNENNHVFAIDQNATYFDSIARLNLNNVTCLAETFSVNMDFDKIIRNADIVYHLVSTTFPTTSNQHISKELYTNVIFSANLLEACVRCKISKIVFISSGGTVYGKEVQCPLKEETPTYPISSYGIQKITIEKLLYLYNYLYGLDYRIIRLANPYGPYQRPNGKLGAVTTFTYKALKNEKITIYGDGSIVRDFIYIDDAIKGILNITFGEKDNRTFNLGSGCGTSINEVIQIVKSEVNPDLKVRYVEGRKVDVPVNFLNIERYEKAYGNLNPINLKDGIGKTAAFLRQWYAI